MWDVNDGPERRTKEDVAACVAWMIQSVEVLRARKLPPPLPGPSFLTSSYDD